MAIRPDQNNLDEFVQLPAGIIPANLNPEFWIVRTNDTLGGPKIYSTLEQFVNLHPNLMEVGMIATVNQHDRDNGTFAATEFKLDVIPELSKFPLSLSPNELDEAGNEVVDGSGNSIPVDNFYGDFWTVSQQFELSSIETVYEYAPDINGLKPPFPYLDNPSAESSWATEYDPATHKWLRSRSTNRQDSGSGIYLDWTIPLPINGNFETGDYTQNLFRRAATTPQLPKGTTKDGLPNNSPSGWQDIPPTNSTDPLYEIRGQKDKYGNLKSAWIGPFLIPEDEDLIRYSGAATPNPNTIVNQTTSATEGSQADTDLIDAGWLKTFDPSIHQYRAKRTENAANDYTNWDVTKIANESGEYIDRIYKLFPINQDFDDVDFINNNTPTGNDPLSNPQGLTRNEDWFDVQQTEDESHINAYSEARKFIDGSLKTPWGPPKPFTGKDTYIDYIRSNGESSFKYTSSDDTSPDPASITLEFFLFKGNNEITNNLTYQWTKIYDNRNVVDVDLGTSKTQVITPSDVTGKAIFRCTATLAIADGDDIVFTEEEPIVDITDGDDAKSLTLSSDTPIVLYDTVEEAFSVDNITIRGFQSFLTGTTFYWYKDDGAGNWVSLGTPASPTANYTLTNQTLSIDTADLFADNGNKEGAKFALSTSDNITDVEDNDEFYAVITVSKLSSAGVGAAGADAITISMSDEVDSVILDRATLLPQADEIGSTGTVKNLIKVFDGQTKLNYVVDTPVAGEWSIVSITSNVNDITFAHQDAGTNDREVYIDTWTNEGPRKVTATITIDIGGLTDNLVKNFVVTTNLDDAGAVIGFLDIASDTTYDSVYTNTYGDTNNKNKALAFTPENRRGIVLVATLDQNGSIITPGSFDGNVVWYFNGVQTNTNISGTNNSAKLVTRADVVGSLAVKAKITYNGQEYFTTPINIDDITDASNYILYHHFGTVPDEPITTPDEPSNTPVSDFETTFNLTPSGTGYFREPGDNTYFYSIGQVEVISGVDTIVFNKALRNRGERGDQGPTPDFLVTMYKANNSGPAPTVPTSNASRTAMLNNQWFFTPNQTTGDVLYSASTTFDGEQLGNLSEPANATWRVTRVSGITGPEGEGVKTYTSGNSPNSNTYRRIASTTLNAVNQRKTLQLSVGARSTRGGGLVTFSGDTLANTNILGVISSSYIKLIETASGTSISYFYRVTEGQLEIWEFSPTSFTDGYYSVLHKFTTGSEWIFYENNNSSTTSAPAGLVSIPTISITDINNELNAIEQSISSIENDITTLQNSNTNKIIALSNNGGLDNLTWRFIFGANSTITHTASSFTSVRLNKSSNFVNVPIQETKNNYNVYTTNNAEPIQTSIPFNVQSNNQYISRNFKGILVDLSTTVPVVDFNTNSNLDIPLSSRMANLISSTALLGSYRLVVSGVSYRVSKFLEFNSGAERTFEFKSDDGVVLYNPTTDRFAILISTFPLNIINNATVFNSNTPLPGVPNIFNTISGNIAEGATVPNSPNTYTEYFQSIEILPFNLHFTK